VLRAPDWVNVIALGEERQVLLVRQWRYGTAAVTLEVPGGMIDPGETPLEAAIRELREETGYAARDWQEIGRTEPNPAFLSNTCISFLAQGLERLGEPTGDGEEELSVESVALDDIPDLIRGGEIRHALVLSAFHWLALRQ
jgi:8-oxo-dGTP pyrophosphatase MutT (NUDIX family)